MSVGYKTVLWNKEKKRYDLVMLLLVAIYLIAFSVIQFTLRPTVLAQTVLIRATGSLALTMLHMILIIGPLCRINKAFLPLLYNRRHAGVTMFIIALIHGLFSLAYYHGVGDEVWLVSLFTSTTSYGSLVNFPFQVLGFFALLILFLMAASSHDFWLKNLSSSVWKGLHMLVYLAYALLIMHVMLGVVQLEQYFLEYALLGVGMFTVIVLHLYSAFNTKPLIEGKSSLDGYYKVGHWSTIPEDRALMIKAGDQDIAVFRYGQKISAVHNVCKHQQGPLSEGKVVDGCITCPWHGWQYRPEDGCSPPPFEERISTFNLRMENEEVWVSGKPLAEGTPVDPLIIQA